MQNRSFGILVFPTHQSDIILGNPSLLHYGSYSKNNDESDYSEEKDQDSKNLSNPIGDNSCSYHGFSNKILTNSSGKSTHSMKSNLISDRDQQKTRNDKKQQNLIMEQQKSLIFQTGNQSVKSNGSKMTNGKNEFIERKLSNHSNELEDLKFPERINIITSTSHSSSCAVNTQSNLQQSNFICNSKSLSPNNMMQAKQKLIEPIIQQRSSADEEEQYMNNIHQRHNADGIVKEILDDLDNALDCDENMSFSEIQQNSQKTASTSGNLLDDSKYSPTCEYDNIRSAYKSKDNKRESEIKSSKIKTTILISDHLNDQLIQELKQLPQGIISLKDYKQKQKNLLIEQEKLLKIDIEEMRKACTLDKYISQVPEFISGRMKLLPPWKRQMLARKIANEDMQ